MGRFVETCDNFIRSYTKTILTTYVTGRDQEYRFATKKQILSITMASPKEVYWGRNYVLSI